MSDQFTKISTTGYATRIGHSIGAAVVGIIMFFGSFALLYWNEGRTDLSGLTAKATEISATEEVDASLEGSPVSVTGEVTVDELVGDLYLKEGPYLLAERRVEMYAWVEEAEERTSSSTTFTYVKEWTSNPRSSSEFADPEGHSNPGMIVKSDEARVGRLMVGNFTVETGTIELPDAQPLALTKENTVLSAGAELASDEFIFLGAGTLSEPVLGDIRVSYLVVPTGFTGTVFGELHGDEIIMHVNDDGDKLFRLFKGARDEAVSTLHQEFIVTMWILRVIGFLFMWCGLSLVIGPIATLLDVLPFLGSTTRFLVGIVMLPVALVLTAITIIISMIIHNVVALVVTLVSIIGLIVWGLKRSKRSG